MRFTFTILSALLFFSINGLAQKPTSRFENLISKKDTSIDGTGKHDFFKSGWVTLHADTTPWSTWSGWAISSMTDTKTPDYTNQFSAIAGSGVNGSKSYAVAYDLPKMNLGKAQVVTGMFITNSTYAFHTIKDGNQFSKKFGGESGTDKDTFVVRANGFSSGKATGFSDFFLADYRFENQADDYIVEDWTWWDLSALGEVDSLAFEFFSSDRGEHGLFTPKYFCMDNFLGTPPTTKVVEIDYENLVVNEKGYYNGDDQLGGFYTSGAYFTNSYNPAWKSWNGFSYSNNADTKTEGPTNQYSTIAGSGANGSKNFAVGNAWGSLTIELPYTKEGTTLKGTYVTNSTYAALSMKNGDDFAKKFGGDSGNEEDWFKAEFMGYDHDNKLTGTVEFYLADYRSSNNDEDYIVDTWQWVDLSGLGGITRLEIVLTSTDVGEYGMKTPAYICLDDFNSPKPVSTREFALTPELNLYPNPTMSQFSVASLNTNDPFEITVFDMKGSVQVQESSKTTLDVAALPAGNYVVRVTQNADVRHLKLSKI